MLTETIPDRHAWFRVADPGWADPCDPAFAAVSGGRWNPPNSFPALYLNEDIVTARINLQLFIAGLPYGPEDLAEDSAPILVHATLPRGQVVADVHTAAGVQAVGLPRRYPNDGAGGVVGHAVSQAIGQQAKNAGLRGVRCRSAQAIYGAGRELAWFPATVRSRARQIAVQPFSDWFWG